VGLQSRRGVLVGHSQARMVRARISEILFPRLDEALRMGDRQEGLCRNSLGRRLRRH
jgi:hypothetical protein